MICLNDHARFGRLNYVSYLFHHLHKAGNLELCRPVVLLHWGEKSGKKEDWLDGDGRWSTSFRDGIAGGSVKNHSSKAELLGGVQVYPEDRFRVVMYQCGGLTQGFLNGQEGSELLGGWRPKFRLRGVGPTLLATERCLPKERSLEGLKGCRELGIEVDIASQVARQAQVVFQSS